MGRQGQDRSVGHIEGERWKEIATPKRYYMISNMGRVLSKRRVLVDKNGKVRNWAERLLASNLGGGNGPNGPKYLCIVLEGRNYFIHRLVANAFVPNPQRKRCINHKNGNKQDNRAANLEWTTHSENMVHASRTGLLRNNKLNVTCVRIILWLLRDKILREKVIAEVFGINVVIIQGIRKGSLWKHVPRLQSGQDYTGELKWQEE